MLHTVNKSPFSHIAFERCLEFLGKDEPVLLYEDGVLAAQSNTKLEEKVRSLLQTNPVYALQEDLKARAINSQVISGIQVIDYEGFVDLVAAHPVHSWT